MGKKPLVEQDGVRMRDTKQWSKDKRIVLKGKRGKVGQIQLFILFYIRSTQFVFNETEAVRESLVKDGMAVVHSVRISLLLKKKKKSKIYPNSMFIDTKIFSYCVTICSVLFTVLK